MVGITFPGDLAALTATEQDKLQGQVTSGVCAAIDVSPSQVEGMVLRAGSIVADFHLAANADSTASALEQNLETAYGTGRLTASLVSCGCASPTCVTIGGKTVPAPQGEGLGSDNGSTSGDATRAKAAVLVDQVGVGSDGDESSVVSEDTVGIESVTTASSEGSAVARLKDVGGFDFGEESDSDEDAMQETADTVDEESDSDDGERILAQARQRAEQVSEHGRCPSSESELSRCSHSETDESSEEDLDRETMMARSLGPRQPYVPYIPRKYFFG